MLDFSLPGTGGMMPLPNRSLTCLLTRYQGSMLLIDCGEGTQVTLKQLGWGFKNIDFICFTHYHADHIAGLPGLLLTIGASNREEPLVLAGPPDLYRVVKSLLVIAPEILFDLEFIELHKKGEEEIALGNYILSTLPVDHSRPCMAYRLDIKRKGKFDLEKAKKLDLPRNFYGSLQRGEEVFYNEKLYTPNMVMGAERKGIRLSYCTDSRPTAELPAFIKGSDLFVCEGLYGDNDKREKAEARKHMIYSEAAGLARDGEVKRLLLTHYSPAMTDPKEHIDNARIIFPETYPAYDRISGTIHFEEE